MHCKSNKIYKRTYRLYMDCTYVHVCANFANFALHDIGEIQNLFLKYLHIYNIKTMDMLFATNI